MTRIISTNMYSDAEQVKKIFDRLGIPGFATLFRPATTLVDIFKGFSAYPTIFAVQRGGGKAQIDQIYESLRTFEVTPVLKQDFDRMPAFPETADAPKPVISSFSQERGLARRYMYRGESSEPYTVCDNFIVTSERIGLVPIVASQITPDVDPRKLAYVVLRLLLLYNDMLQSRYESLSTNEEITPVLNENSQIIGYAESDVNFIEHKRLHVETETLFDIVTELQGTNDFAKAIRAASQLMLNKQRWTNDTVNLYAEDRFGVRNNDFTRTFGKIQQIQDLILLTYFQPKAGGVRKTRRARKSKTRRSTA